MEACEKLLRYSRYAGRYVIEAEIGELKIALDFMSWLVVILLGTCYNLAYNVDASGSIFIEITFNWICETE